MPKYAVIYVYEMQTWRLF